MEFSRPNTGVGSLSLLQGISSTQGSNPGLPLRRQILYQLSPRKPKNPGLGSLSLLQQIFPTQESNQGLLHCRQILYQLSYQRRPHHFGTCSKNINTSYSCVFGYMLHMDSGRGNIKIQIPIVIESVFFSQISTFFKSTIYFLFASDSLCLL